MNTNKQNVPGMYDDEVRFAGITLRVDPINRPRTEGSDNVMAIFHEEQPLMWEFVKGDLAKTINAKPGSIDYIDVGTGSGVWAILVAKNIDAKKVLAIDKSSRAIQEATANAKRNGVMFKLQEEFYNMGSAPYHSASAIGIYAPYHLYPAEVEMKIPQHARGGIDGQQIFKEELVVANYHLAKGGVIVFNQMCLGKNGKPQFTKYIPELVEDSSLKYTNVLPLMQTAYFLKSIYGGLFPDYQEQTAKEYPELYYCNGIIIRDGKGSEEVVEHDLDLKGRTWEHRIELHCQIALHGV